MRTEQKKQAKRRPLEKLSTLLSLGIDRNIYIFLEKEKKRLVGRVGNAGLQKETFSREFLGT